MSDPRRPKRDPYPYQQPNGYWYILFSQLGKSRKWVATGIESRYFKDWKAHVPAVVNELASTWGRLWRDGRYDPWEDERPGRVTAEQTVATYLSQKNVAPSTVKAQRTTLEPFIAQFSAGFAVTGIQPKHVRKFVSRPDLKPSPREAYYNILRTFFSYCLEKKWIYDDPMSQVDRPTGGDESRTVFLPREYKRIMRAAHHDAASNSQRDVVLDAYDLAVTTGMRVGELCSRTWADIDLDRRLLRVDDQPICGFKVKTAPSRRNIPLFPRALAVFARRQELRISEDVNEPILISPRPKVGSVFLLADWLSRRFTEHRDAAGFPEGTIHDLRHSFTTYVLALGVPESKVMKMTGHVKYDTIAKYTHIIDELLQEAPDEARARHLPGYKRTQKPREES